MELILRQRRRPRSCSFFVSLFSLEEETDVTTNTTNIREVVLDVLLEVLENHNLSHIVLKQALEKYLFLERQDRAFITRCVEGTLEYRIQIDAVLDRFSKVKTAKMKPNRLSSHSLYPDIPEGKLQLHI